jgi:hypothetical protein
MPSTKTSAPSPKHNNTVADRLAAAAAAKQAMLERFKSRPSADDPAYIEQQAQLKAISDAREARAVERRAERQAEAERQAAAAAAKKAEQAATEAERQRQAREAAFRAEALAREQKAKRDARYAARKARK